MQCVKSQDVAGGRGDRGLYNGRNVSGVRMWLELGETEDSMVDAMYKEQGCGWRWTQCIRRQDVVGGRSN